MYRFFKNFCRRNFYRTEAYEIKGHGIFVKKPLNNRALVAIVITLAAFFSMTHDAVSSERPDLATEDTALNFVTDRIQTIQNITKTQDMDRVIDLFEDSFSVTRISRFVIGRVWRTLTPEQLAEYESAFGRYATNWIRTEILQHIGDIEDYTIQAAIPEKRGDRLIGYTVLSSFQTSSHGLTDVQWRLRLIDGDLKIVDLVVKGISIAISQRTFFQSILQKEDGIEGLIKFLNDAASPGHSEHSDQKSDKND